MKIVHVSLKMAPWVLVDDVSVAGAWSERQMNIAGGCWHPDAAYREVAAEARDVVSAAELTAHISPRRLEFVGADAILVPVGTAVADGSVTGAAFFEAPAALRVETGDLVMTFVDDRLGGFLRLREAVPVAPAVEDASAPVLRLSDDTVIRLTGMIQGLSRRAAGATQMFGLGGASFAT